MSSLNSKRLLGFFSHRVSLFFQLCVKNVTSCLVCKHEASLHYEIWTPPPPPRRRHYLLPPRARAMAAVESHNDSHLSKKSSVPYVARQEPLLAATGLSNTSGKKVLLWLQLFLHDRYYPWHRLQPRSTR